MSEIARIYNSDQYASLRDLEYSRYEIKQRLQAGDFPVPELEAGFRTASAKLSADIETIAKDGDIQNPLAEEGIKSIAALAELEQLRSILDADEYKTIEDSIKAKLQSARAHFEIYGAVTPEAQEFINKAQLVGAVAAGSEVSQPTEVSASALPLDPVINEALETPAGSEQMKQRVVLTIGERVVRIGKRGGIVKFSLKAPGREDQTDYTKMRRNAFLYVMTHEGEIVPGDVYKASIGEDFDIQNPEHRMAASEIRRWMFEKPTFRNSPMVLTNVKRGSGSRWWKNPNFDVVLNFDQRTELPMQSDPEKTKEIRVKIEADLGPLTPRESDFFISARHLAEFNFLLEESNLPVIDEQICKDLERYAPDLSHLRGVSEEIIKYRNAALARVIEFISDEQELFVFLDSVDLSDARYKFVDYISSFDDQERMYIERLFKAHMQVKPALYKGSINGTEKQAIDEHGDVIPPLYLHRVEPTQVASALSFEEEIAEVDDEPEVEIVQPVVAVEEITITPSADQEETKPNGRERKLQEAKLAIESLVDGLIEKQIDPNDTYKGGQVEYMTGRRGIFNRRSIDKILGGKKLERAHPDREFTFREIVLANVYNDRKLRSIYEQFRKELDNMIDASVEAARIQVQVA